MADHVPASPPAVDPDDKDWTWVLQRACPECGFDASAFPVTELGVLLRANAATWAALLVPTDATAADRLRFRPDPQTWSPLEYSCHVRDVFRLYTWRLQLMLGNDGPHFENWDQDATAVAERYDLADPRTVRVQLLDAAETLAASFDGVAGETWHRTGFRSDGAAFTIETFGRYLLHDPVHHLVDVGLGPTLIGPSEADR